jgi:predicted GIY-YIG superfamily endonuclease
MNGLSKATKNKLPVKLVFVKEFLTLPEARSYEFFIKRQRNRTFYEKLIDGPIV